MRISTNPHKRLGPYSALVVGVIVILGGLQALLSDVPDCGGKYMESTDECVEFSGGPGAPHGGVYTADQELHGTHLGGIAAMVAGAVVAAIAVLVIYRRRRRQARNIWTRLHLSPQDAATGTTRRIEFTGRRLRRYALPTATVRIPPGTRDRVTVRVGGRGLPGTHRRPTGDLLVAVYLTDRTRKSRHHKTSAAATGSTISTRRVRVNADPDSLEVDRFDSVRSRWEPHVRLRWSEVVRLSFATDPHDPVVGLYAVTTSGRRYLFDSAHLTEEDWSRFAAAVSAATDGRITIDPSARSRV